MKMNQRDFIPVREDFMAGLTPAEALACLRHTPDPQPANGPGLPDDSLRSDPPLIYFHSADSSERPRAEVPDVDACYLRPSALTPAELRLVEHMEAVNKRHIDALQRDMAKWADRHPGKPFAERRRNGLRHPHPVPRPTGTTYSPPQGVPDGYTGGVYCPSQHVLDMSEADRARRIAEAVARHQTVQVTDGGRAQFVTCEDTCDEFARQAKAEEADMVARLQQLWSEWGVWLALAVLGGVGGAAIGCVLMGHGR